MEIEITIDGHYMGTFNVDSLTGYAGTGEFSFKTMIKMITTVLAYTVWPILAAVCPFVFFMEVLPAAPDLLSAFLEGSHIIVLFLVALLNIGLIIWRAIWRHKLLNSADEKYVELRREIINAEDIEDDEQIIDEDDKVFLRKASTPIDHALKTLRSVLFIVFINMMAVTLAFPESAIGGTVMAFAYPLFAYGYILSVVNSYMAYGKKANYCWLFLLAATFIGYLFMSVSFFKPVSEYIVLALIILFHGLGDRLILKRIADK